MGSELTWDEAKRRSNLLKHGLDFAQAHWVLDARYWLDIAAVRQGKTRIVSFRPASADESESFYEWIAQDATDT